MIDYVTLIRWLVLYMLAAMITLMLLDRNQRFTNLLEGLLEREGYTFSAERLQLMLIAQFVALWWFFLLFSAIETVKQALRR